MLWASSFTDQITQSVGGGYTIGSLLAIETGHLLTKIKMTDVPYNM